MNYIQSAVIIILLFLGAFFLLRSLNANEDDWLIASKRIFTYTENPRAKPPSREQLAAWQKEFDFHLDNGIRTYNEAKDKCWYLPDISDRDKARYCFTSAIATIGSYTPSTKLIACVTSLLLQYGLDAMDEWNYIQNKLYWSAYHFDLCDHYYHLIHQ